ncbi:hypothetical protein BJ508DRAFT_309006 [Ascobolus immersus RN42]|uniref:Uncharacterized protein n=1 Tax=Ascobolus immersus RN42 TaxID=1160509 RepID=A0A3N4HXV3_ASCIM|nr:hypothetical protein BJ508DRAFT_309006 [Ascobolus immersus RN42]
MLGSLRRKQTPSQVQPNGRSTSAEPASNETERRRPFSSPVTAVKSTENDETELRGGDDEHDATTGQRPKSASSAGKGAHRLSMQLNNGNLNRITEEASSKRPGTSGSARREPARHPNRISEEQDQDLSRVPIMNGRTSFQEEDEHPANPTQAWRAAAARVAAKESNGELRRLRADSNEDSIAKDRQAALESLTGSLDTRPTSNGSATVNGHIGTDDIHTSPTGSKRESSVFGGVYKLDTRPVTPRGDEHSTSPKPRSPASPSKTAFPRGHDGFDLSAAPPIPPLPTTAPPPPPAAALYSSSVASSSQETLSHYVTPKSSFYNERGTRDDDYAPAHFDNGTQDLSNGYGNAGVLGAVQNTFNMFARGIMPGKYPGSQATSAAISQKSSTETLRNLAAGQADIDKPAFKFPAGATAPPLTGHGKVANWREIVAEEVKRVGGHVDDVDSDNDDLISLAGNSIYETADEYMSDDGSDDGSVMGIPTPRNNVRFAAEDGQAFPTFEVEQQKWENDSDADSDDTIGDVKTTPRTTVPPRAPSPPRSAETPSPVEEEEEEEVVPAPPTPVRHSPPSSPKEPKPILKRPESAGVGLERTISIASSISRKSSSSSVKSVDSYKRVIEPVADTKHTLSFAALRSKPAADRISKDADPSAARRDLEMDRNAKDKGNALRVDKNASAVSVGTGTGGKKKGFWGKLMRRREKA